MHTNKNFDSLQDSYLFSEIARRVREHKTRFQNAEVISLGIGDVTLPLAPIVISAMQEAVTQMGSAETFKGYGEEQGYLFLREAVCGYYKTKGVELAPSEVFISDGAKSDIANFLDITAEHSRVLIPSPVYPVYVDTNIMRGSDIIYANGNIENGFLPLPDYETNADIIYICSPNNPTGAVYNKEQLTEWVNYAIKKDAIILFDSAYEAFVTDKALPTSIFEIEGANTCAVEFCSLSKTAGFTGTRCGYTVVPNGLIKSGKPLNKLWLRRQTTKFNGVPYIVQRGAAAVFTKEGISQTRRGIEYYLNNAKLIANLLKDSGVWYTGGNNSPYIWLKCPNNIASWDFFDMLLEKAHVVGTPGSGFGANGEGFFRLTSFGKTENITEAINRIKEHGLCKQTIT